MNWGTGNETLSVVLFLGKNIGSFSQTFIPCIRIKYGITTSVYPNLLNKKQKKEGSDKNGV